MTSQQDTGYAPDHWAFDDEVTRVFDDMLQRSIPQYDVMRKAVFDVAAPFVRPGSDIVDLGASRGESLAPFVFKFGAYNHFYGVEVSQPMLAALRDRFSGYTTPGVVNILDLDLRENYPPALASVTLSILTMMFIPLDRRQALVQMVYDHTIEGGVFVMVEKVLGATARLDDLMVSTYYQRKREEGYTDDEIERKRLSLQGVLVPVMAEWNECLLHSAGFSQVDCFWRWMNFAGWLAIK